MSELSEIIQVIVNGFIELCKNNGIFVALLIFLGIFSIISAIGSKVFQAIRFLFMIFVAIPAIFIVGIILFLTLRILGGSGSYEETIRILSYSSAVQVFSWIPHIGWIIGMYGIWLTALGSTYIHKLTFMKSAAGIFISGGILVIMLAIIGS